MAKSRKPRPSFDGPADDEGPADTGWVYRSEDATGAIPLLPPPAPEPPVADVRPVHQAVAVVPVARTPIPERSGVDAGAKRIVDRHAAVAGAASLLPVPVIDAAAISAVQLAMVRALAGHYGVPFRRERGKALVTAILGGILPVASGPGVVRFVLGLVPVAGPLVALATLPALAGGVTYAVGQAFASHFATGGTLDDIDVQRSRRSVAHAVAQR